MLNYYLVKSEGKYLNINGEYPIFTDKKSATRFEDKFSADYMAGTYELIYSIEEESYDK